MFGHLASVQPAACCFVLKLTLTGPVTIGSTPSGASAKSCSASVAASTFSDSGAVALTMECAAPAAKIAVIAIAASEKPDRGSKVFVIDNQSLVARMVPLLVNETYPTSS